MSIVYLLFAIQYKCSTKSWKNTPGDLVFAQVGPGDDFVLMVGGFNAALSTLGDALTGHNGAKFSTKWVKYWYKLKREWFKPTILTRQGTRTRMATAVTTAPSLILVDGGTQIVAIPTPRDWTVPQKWTVSIIFSTILEEREGRTLTVGLRQSTYLSPIDFVYYCNNLLF